jgi:hypothetical protein
MATDQRDGDPGKLQEAPDGLRVGWWGTVLLGLYHLAFGGVLMYALCAVWPPQPWPKEPGASPVPTSTDTDKDRVAAAASPPSPSVPGTNVPASPTTKVPSGARSASDYPPSMHFFRYSFQPTLDVRLILLVLFAGALGSFIHSATSFVDYVGNRAFIASWVWWYLLRPFIGAALALLIYFVIRGGFVTGTLLPQESANAAAFINPYGMAALAGLAGLFAKQATDKLNEVFTTLFRSAEGQGDAKRRDPLADKSTPNITSIDPRQVVKGTQDVSIAIKGSNFSDAVVVKVGDVTLKPESISPSEIVVRLPPAMTAAAGERQLVVVNQLPTGAMTSNQITLVVAESAGNG